MNLRNTIEFGKGRHDGQQSRVKVRRNLDLIVYGDAIEALGHVIVQSPTLRQREMSPQLLKQFVGGGDVVEHIADQTTPKFTLDVIAGNKRTATGPSADVSQLK